MKCKPTCALVAQHHGCGQAPIDGLGLGFRVRVVVRVEIRLRVRPQIYPKPQSHAVYRFTTLLGPPAHLPSTASVSRLQSTVEGLIFSVRLRFRP